MIATLDKKSLKCYHCGDNCADDSIKIDSLNFCCNGCKTVYEILNENALCEYYVLSDNPGNKKNTNVTQEFLYLDDEKIQNSLLKFKEGDVSAVTFYIPTIHCSSCIWLLENLHKILPGVINTNVHFQRKEMDIQFDKSVTIRKLAELLSSLGYAPSITLEGKEVSNHSVNRRLYYKLGIAGFCFGNIMMLSLPEYLSVYDEFNGELKVLFTYLSLLLSLPVFVYCASDYFISAYNAIKNKIINIDLPIALGLVAAFSQSVFEILSGSGVGYLDSLTGLVFFLLIGKWYQSKTYEALAFDRDYKSYFPLTATRVAGKQESYVALDELNPGDFILVKNNEIIPADGIIAEGSASIDYSFVTGEAVPVEKKYGQPVFAGGKQVGAAIKVKLTKKVSESYLTQLWNKDAAKAQQSNLLDFTNRVGKYFTITVLLLSVATYLFWVGRDSGTALYSAVSVLIIFCPCTLALAIPFCFGNAMNILGRNGFYLKQTDVIEKLSGNDTLVFDKTGTITSTEDSEISIEAELTEKEQQLVKALAKNSTHPLAKILSLKLPGSGELKPDQFYEIPSLGMSGIIQEQEIKMGSAAFVGCEGTHEDGSTRVYVSINNICKGSFKFKNKYRDNLKTVLSQLSKKFNLHLLSGDKDSERSYLSSFFKADALHFNQSPLDKLSYVEKLNKKNKVMMIGDGLNDAGALLSSRCGISVIENTASFSPASDVIMEASQFSKLPSFIAFSNACLRTVYISLLISLLYNVIGLYFAMQGQLKPLVAAILMPLSSVSIVLFVTVISNLLAKKYKLI